MHLHLKLSASWQTLQRCSDIRCAAYVVYLSKAKAEATAATNIMFCLWLLAHRSLCTGCNHRPTIATVTTTSTAEKAGERISFLCLAHTS